MHSGQAAHAVSGTWLLRAAFVVITSSFVATTVYTQGVVRQIDANALAITQDAAPAIEHVAAARSEARRIESLVSAYVHARQAGAEPPLQELDESRAILVRHLTEYFALPRGSEERATSVRFTNELLAFNAETMRVLRAADAGAFVEARAIEHGALDDAADSLATVATALVTSNARAGHDLAAGTLELRNRAEVLAYILVAACAALAIATLLVGEHLVRRNQELAAEQTRLLAERAAELESFSCRMAHDVLSPLAGASLTLRTLKRKPELAGDAPLLERIDRSIKRVRMVVDGLLAFARAGARAQPGDLADVNAVVSEVLDETKDDAQAARIELCAELNPNVPPIACSEGVLVSIVSNLVCNAIKYMGERHVRRVRVAVATKGDAVRVEVSDTGPGIPACALPTLFEPYVRATRGAQPGMGLGLATVKRLAEGHGGSVGVSSIVGEGTVFWVELPKPASEGTRVAASG